MKPFRFCPACGAQIDEPDEAKGAECPRCGHTWYRNPSPAVSAVLVRNGRALVVTRASDPHKGLYDSPGGFVHVGEELLDALKREVREELGVEIDVADDDFLGATPHTYGDDGDWLLSLGFRARLVAGEPRAADDVASVEWVTLAELDDLDFAWEHNREQTRRALEHETEKAKG